MFNKFLGLKNIQPGMVLRGVVTNKEAKGYSLDMCMADSTQGFISATHVTKRLKTGEVVLGCVEKVKGKVIRLMPTKDGSPIPLKTSVPADSVKPGFIVRSRVSKIIDNGIHVTCMGGLDAYIFEDHLTKELKKYK